MLVHYVEQVQIFDQVKVELHDSKKKRIFNNRMDFIENNQLTSLWYKAAT